MNQPNQYEGKYLTFSLAQEGYGIQIKKVREIIGMMPITEMPQREDFIKGVINLRGKVISIVDLRARFAKPDSKYTDRTCIIVVELQKGTGIVPVGLVVDSVAEVLQIKEDQVEAPVQLGSASHTAFISGLAKIDNTVQILLDIDRLLPNADLGHFDEAA